jgi:hypothetical protein
MAAATRYNLKKTEKLKTKAKMAKINCINFDCWLHQLIMTYIFIGNMT